MSGAKVTFFGLAEGLPGISPDVSRFVELSTGIEVEGGAKTGKGLGN
jgi:hypothetical protein